MFGNVIAITQPALCLGMKALLYQRLRIPGEQRITDPGAIHSASSQEKKKKKWSLLNPSLASFLPRMPHSSMSPLLKYPFFPKLFPNFKKRRLSLLLLLCRIMQRPQYTFCVYLSQFLHLGQAKHQSHLDIRTLGAYPQNPGPG